MQLLNEGVHWATQCKRIATVAFLVTVAVGLITYCAGIQNRWPYELVAAAAGATLGAYINKRWL